VRVRLPVFAVLVLGSLVAGCAGPAAPTSTTTAPAATLDAFAAARASMAGVPCSARADADSNSGNLKLLSRLVLPAADDGIHAELDVRGHLAVHARYGSSGFELYDLSDPTAPRHLGNWTHDPQDGALDVKFTPDNATVLVGVGNAIHLVDVRDPMAPRQVGEWTSGQASPAGGPAATLFYNSHMLFSRRIAGKDWVFLAPNADSGVWVLEIGGTPDNRTLTYVAQTLPVEGGPLGPHDLYVQRDGLDGHWYLYSADGVHGWTVFNVDDPTHPTVAGGWVNPAEASYTHTVQAATIAGKRIVATIGEIGGNLLRVYDATTLAAPVLLGVWEAKAEDTTSPEHDFNIVAGRLYLAYYGHGLFVFNLTSLAQHPSAPLAGSVSLVPEAHYGVPGEGGGAGPTAFNGFWDAVVVDGVIYVSHIEGGLVVLGYGCNAIGDPHLTSDG